MIRPIQGDSALVNLKIDALFVDVDVDIDIDCLLRTESRNFHREILDLLPPQNQSI